MSILIGFFLLLIFLFNFIGDNVVDLPVVKLFLDGDDPEGHGQGQGGLIHALEPEGDRQVHVVQPAFVGQHVARFLLSEMGTETGFF